MNPDIVRLANAVLILYLALEEMGADLPALDPRIEAAASGSPFG